jgi:hypothetical protein
MQDSSDTEKEKQPVIRTAHHINRVLLLAVFFLLQTTFIILILKEYFEFNTFETLLSIASASLLLAFGYRYLDLHHETHSYEDSSVVAWVTVGAIICYLLNVYANLGGVLSAGLTGTIASFIPSFRKKSEYLKQLPAPIYCGAFIGMSSIIIASSIYFVIIAGVISGFIFMLSKSLFVGVGGKLGTVAFAGVVIASFIFILFK